MGIAIFLLVNGRLQYHGLTVRGCFVIASSIARNWTMKFALLRAWLEGKGISWGTSRIAKEEVFRCMEEVLRKGDVRGSRKQSEKVIYVE
jgi:hypothetical protein